MDSFTFAVTAAKSIRKIKRYLILLRFSQKAALTFVGAPSNQMHRSFISDREDFPEPVRLVRRGWREGVGKGLESPASNGPSARCDQP
jgi:hypothetical protein